MSMVSASEEPDVRFPVAALAIALERGASHLHLTLGANATPERDDLVRRDDCPIMTPDINTSNDITTYYQPVLVPGLGAISRSRPTIVYVREIA